MASYAMVGLDSLMLSMREIAKSPEEVQDAMLNEIADVTLKAQVSEGKKLDVHDTGKTLEKIVKKKPVTTKNGRVIYITFSGTRTRHGIKTRNAEIAFVNEFGKKGQKARPFIKMGNEKSAEEATAAAFRVYDRWLQSKNL